LFFEWTRISASEFFSLVRIGQILILHCFALSGRRIPKDSKEWWSFDCFLPLFSPRTFAGEASSWEGWSIAGRVVVILTLCFFFPWKVQLSSNASRVFLKKPKTPASHSMFQMGWHLPISLETSHRSLLGG